MQRRTRANYGAWVLLFSWNVCGWVHRWLPVYAKNRPTFQCFLQQWLVREQDEDLKILSVWAAKLCVCTSLWTFFLRCFDCTTFAWILWAGIACFRARRPQRQKENQDAGGGADSEKSWSAALSSVFPGGGGTWQIYQRPLRLPFSLKALAMVKITADLLDNSFDT